MTSSEKSPAVLILMAVYNGLPFIEPQIDSLKIQTFEDWLLLVRDDGSTDGTQEWLRQLAVRESRVRFHPTSGQASGSSKRNFALLLDEAKHYSAEIICLCDQDDVWNPDRLSVVVAHSCAPAEVCPTLLVSDLECIDDKGELIKESFWDEHGVPNLPDISAAELCSRNLFPGCSMVLNRALLDLACPVPNAVIMHDWWIAILALAGGTVDKIPMSLVAYRQHYHNEIGVTDLGVETRLFCRGGVAAGADAFRATFNQAEAALERLTDHGITGAGPLQVARYVALARMPVWSRTFETWRLGIRRNNVRLFAAFFIRQLLQLPLLGYSKR